MSVTAKSLTEFGVEVLYVLYAVDTEGQPDFLNNDFIHDIDVWKVGQRQFGIGWGGTKKKTTSLNYDYDYAPTVAMKLGSLARTGLVRKMASDWDYSTWDITEDGRQLLREYGLIE